MPCPACPGKNKCVSPSGPECNDCTNQRGIVFIGEAPGGDEDRKGIPFVGKTGREVNEHYLPLAGLRRDNLRFTNAIRCLPDVPKHKLDSKKEAHRNLLQSCAEWHLYPELERTKPQLIVPMGAFACLALDPSINLEMHHGLPLDTPYGLAFPMYHPAGGIHEPKKMLQIRTDWARLRKYLTNTLHVAVDEYPNPDYRECETPAQLDEYMEGMEEYPLATDTETTRKKQPYCDTISNRPGTGRLIRATSLDVLQRQQFWLNRHRGHLLFHNWDFDVTVVEMMGLDYPFHLVQDTMVKSFHLGNLPQGLKALSYRHSGMLMQDFDDLVTPYSQELVLDYYRRASMEEWSKPEPQLVKEKGVWKQTKPWGFGRKLKGFWREYGKNADKDAFEMWQDNWDMHHAEVQGVLGEWPGKCISHVPFDKILYYACRDADATLRIWPIMQHMERRVRRTVQERWGDAA